MPDAINSDAMKIVIRPVRPSRNSHGRSNLMGFAGGMLCLVLGTAFSVSAQAQSTVVIGGSGESNVEVNLDVLEPSGSQSPYGRGLKMPGMKDSSNIQLRMPGVGTSRPAVSSVPKLTLKRPAKPGLSIGKRAPAVARVSPPSKIAVPAVQAAKPKAPVAISRPAAKPVTKRVQVAKLTPVVTPPPPPPPAPKLIAPKPVQKITRAPVVPTVPMALTRKIAPAPVTAAPRVMPAPAPAKQQVTSLPPSINISTPGLAMQVGFSGNSTRISADEKLRLNAFANKMAAGNDRLQLKSFAGGSGETPSAARRRSLSRALAVRSYLIEKGIRSTRIDVRALGMAADQGPSDRVDVIILVR